MSPTSHASAMTAHTFSHSSWSAFTARPSSMTINGDCGCCVTGATSRSRPFGARHHASRNDPAADGHQRDRQDDTSAGREQAFASGSHWNPLQYRTENT